MANRLTDTNIWKNQKWFKKLPVLYKLAWKYLTDMCDQAGIWKIDMPELIDDLGVEEFDFKDFMVKCNYDLDKKTGQVINRQRILQFDQSHVWITGFMAFQYGGKTRILNEHNLSIVGSKKILKALNLWDLGILEGFYLIKEESPSKPLQATTSDINPLEAHKDKEKDKDNTITNKESIDSKEELDSNNLKEENEEEPDVVPEMLSPKMISIFKKYFPSYDIDLKNDYGFCLQMAYKIARKKSWTKESVYNGKMNDCLKSWETIVQWVKNDDYYSGLSLDFLNRQWSGLIQKMSKPKKDATHQQSATKKSEGATMLLRKLKDDLRDNELNG